MLIKVVNVNIGEFMQNHKKSLCNSLYYCFVEKPAHSPVFFVLLLQIRTVQVSNISLAASERDIKEFFSFSGDIQFVEMLRSLLLEYLAICFPNKSHSEECLCCFVQGK